MLGQVVCLGQLRQKGNVDAPAATLWRLRLKVRPQVYHIGDIVKVLNSSRSQEGSEVS